MSRILTAPIFALLFVGVLFPTHGYTEGFFEKAKERLTPSSVRVIKRIVRGEKPNEAVDNVIREDTKAVQEVTRALTELTTVQIEVIRGLAGDDAASLVGWSKMGEIFLYNNIESTAASVERILVDGKPVETVLDIPLASALRQAHDYYDSRAVPIPKDVKKLMSLTFESAFLERARYVVSTFEGNLPAIINTLQTDFGEFRAVKYDKNGNEISNPKKVHAVVVGDIIVFSDEVPATSIFFWAHELHHIAQYDKEGFEGFATRYRENYALVESEADEVGKKAVSDAETIMRVLIALGNSK